MSKKVLTYSKAFISDNEGVVGTPTPIKDKDGVELKVGDLVYAQTINEGHTCHSLDFVVCETGKYFVFGSYSNFNNDGTYENIVIKKIKGCEELKAGDWTHAGMANIEVEEEADE